MLYCSGMPQIDVISRYDAFLLDVDGVLIRGSRVLDGSPNALASLRRQGRVLLLTNNSSRTRANLAERLTDLGISISSEDVLPTSRIAALYLRQEAGTVQFWPLGEEGLVAELEMEGHRLAPSPADADWVVAGIDRQMTYGSLSNALDALRNGAKLLATNTDPTFPVPGGVRPGAGALVGALRGMGFEPHAEVGKPSAYAYRVALEILGVPAERALMVGDRLETDIEGGRRAGLDTALLLTGVSDRAIAAQSPIQPTWIAESLAALVLGDAEAITT